MKLLEDLGTRPIGTAKKKRRYGLYECPICFQPFTTMVTKVNSGRVVMCPGCVTKHNAKMLVHKAANGFTTKAIEVHGAKYDYSLVEYRGATNKVTIICPTHGPFLQTPSDHKSGCGCPKCSKVSVDDFLDRAKKAHGDRYDYTLVNYQGTGIKVAIICREHGVFNQTPGNHMDGKGCPECKKLSMPEFVHKASQTHGNKYDYTKVVLVSVKQKVEIVCKQHGSFWQLPGHHTSGQGCPICSVSGFDNNKPAILYYLKVTSSSGSILYKIGITNRSIQERFRLKDLEKLQVLKIWDFPLGADAYNKEQEILEQFKEFKYIGEPILSSGNTELFTVDVLQLDNEKDSI